VSATGRVGKLGRILVLETPGRDLEQPARGHPGEEVHGPQDRLSPNLESHPSPDATGSATNGPWRVECQESRKKATSDKKVAPAQPGSKKGCEGSKKAEVLRLLRRPKGATLLEIMTAPGWEAQTVWGFVSGMLIKKHGLKVKSFRSEDQERIYRIRA